MGTRDFFYTNDLDLTDEQIKITQETYFKFAGNYVSNFERKPGALEKTRPITLDPFIFRYKKINLNQPVLFAGCGSCRDLDFAARHQIPTFGVDVSKPLLNIARKMGVDAPLEVMDISKMEFASNSFDGIFCETALAHTKKSNLPSILKNFYHFIRPQGIALIGFRLGDGQVFYTNDSVGGFRYYTTLTRNEITSLLTTAGFHIISQKTTLHSIKSRPPFLETIVQKPS